MSTLRLYEITNEYQLAIQSMFTSPDGKGDESLLDAIKDSFDSKSIAVAKYIKSLEAEAAAVKEAAKAMADRAKTLANQAESLTDYLRYNIEKSGLLDPIKCNEFVIKLQQNPASLEIYDAALIPELYKSEEVVVKIDNAKLKQDIKDGFEVDGARLVSEKRLVIK